MRGLTFSPRALILTAIIALYVAISCTYMVLPGLHYDGVLFGSAALGDADGSFEVYSWKIFGVEVPVMLMNYIGAPKAWLYAPLFALFGTGPWTIRLPMVVLGVVILLCVERVADMFFGKRAALICVALLAVDPTFVFDVREDFGPVVIMLVSKMASLLLLGRFASQRRPAQLFAGFFLLGLGLFDKFNFLWHIAAAGAAACVVWPEGRKLVTLRNVAVASAAFILGCWPLLVFNLVSHGRTFEGVAPDPNPALVFHAKLAVMRAALEGLAFPNLIVGSPPDTATLLPWALLLSIPVAVFARRHLAIRPFLFCWLVMLLVALAILVTPKATGPHHAMMLWPFPELVVGAACAAAVDPLGVRFSRFVGYAAAAAVFASSISLDAQTLSAFHRTGGHGNWSDAIYPLAGSLTADQQHRYLIMDWGLSTQVTLLSRGRAHDEEIFWSLLDTHAQAATMDILYRRAIDPKTRFVFRAPRFVTFAQPRNVFNMMLAEHGMREEVLQRFREREGAEAYYVVRAVKADPGGPSDDVLTAHAWLHAEPVEPYCFGKAAVLSISWSAPGVQRTQVRVATPDGALFSAASENGTAVTGAWVTQGTAFYLQDVSEGRPLTSENTIAKLVPHIRCP